MPEVALDQAPLVVANKKSCPSTHQDWIAQAREQGSFRQSNRLGDGHQALLNFLAGNQEFSYFNKYQFIA